MSRFFVLFGLVPTSVGTYMEAPTDIDANRVEYYFVSMLK